MSVLAHPSPPVLGVTFLLWAERRWVWSGSPGMMAGVRKPWLALLLCVAASLSDLAFGVRRGTHPRVQRLREVFDDDEEVVAVSGTYDGSAAQLRKKSAAEAPSLLDFLPEDKKPASLQEQKELEEAPLHPVPPLQQAAWAEEEPVFKVSGTRKDSLIKVSSGEASSNEALLELSGAAVATNVAPPPLPHHHRVSFPRDGGHGGVVSAVSGTFDDMAVNPEKKARLLALPQFASWAVEDAVTLTPSAGGHPGGQEVMSQEIFVNPVWDDDDDVFNNNRGIAQPRPRPRNPYAEAESRVLELAQAESGMPGLIGPAFGIPVTGTESIPPRPVSGVQLYPTQSARENYKWT